VRKIMGNDGREKIQLRLDMGLLQMEMTGRPDGDEPEGAESLFALHQQRAKDAEEAGDDFELSTDEVGELQAEGIQFYHRYIALYQLEDWVSVARDTKRNLDMFSFVAKHAPSDEVAWSVQQFRPYVMMMNARAKAQMALEKSDPGAAISVVERAIEKIQRFYNDTDHADLIELSPELSTLREMLEQFSDQRTLSPLEKMEHDMESAIRAEDYERAAALRDSIRAIKESK
jgi:hypothetical protein